jgi:hypothetical protein
LLDVRTLQLGDDEIIGAAAAQLKNRVIRELEN